MTYRTWMSKSDETNKNFRAFIEFKIIINKINKKDLAEYCGITYPTFCRKLNRPGNFTLYEVRKMIEALGISDSELITLVRGGMRIG